MQGFSLVLKALAKMSAFAGAALHSPFQQSLLPAENDCRTIGYDYAIMKKSRPVLSNTPGRMSYEKPWILALCA
ncbi:MAG: hypothetical protein ACOYJC_07205 [Christensenellales bacterium]|jgi:hypothetical protein